MWQTGRHVRRMLKTPPLISLDLLFPVLQNRPDRGPLIYSKKSSKIRKKVENGICLKKKFDNDALSIIYCLLCGILCWFLWGCLHISVRILVWGYLRFVLQMQTSYNANLCICIIMQNSTLVCMNCNMDNFTKLRTHLVAD